MASKKNKSVTPEVGKLPPNAHIAGAGVVEQQAITDTLRENYMPYAMSDYVPCHSGDRWLQAFAP